MKRSWLSALVVVFSAAFSAEAGYAVSGDTVVRKRPEWRIWTRPGRPHKPWERDGIHGVTVGRREETGGSVVMRPLPIRSILNVRLNLPAKRTPRPMDGLITSCEVLEDGRCRYEFVGVPRRHEL